MDNKVNFLRGTATEYAASTKDNDTFYYTTDDEKLYLGNKEITGGGVTIDDTLSDTSKNPVQNKVINAALNNKAELSDIPTTLPANGGNADTAKTLSSWAGNAVLDLNNAPLGFSRAPGHAENNPFDFWVTSLLLGGYSDKYKQQYVFPWGNSNSKQMPKYRVYDNGAWCDWQSCAAVNTSTANLLINSLGIGDTAPHDEDYYITQYAGGGESNTNFYRKPTSKLWEYIKGKAAGEFVSKADYDALAARVAALEGGTT